MFAVFFAPLEGIAIIMIPLEISKEPTTLRYHLDGTLSSNVLANGNTLAYLAYSVLKSLCRSLEILGDILSTPRKMKKAPNRTERLFNTIFDILFLYELSSILYLKLAH